MGIRSVNDLLMATREQLSQIRGKMTYWDQIQFEKLCSTVRECFEPENLELKKVLDSISESEHYSLFSGKK